MKLVFLGIALAFLLFTGLWFSENPGTVQINWLGYDIETNPLVLTLIVLIAYIALSVLMNMVEWVVSIPSKIRGASEKRAHRVGLNMMTQATEALLAGNGKAALKAAIKAKELLPESPLPLFYAAKAAHMQGDVSRSKEYLHTLAQNKDTALLGIRGLMHYAAEDHHPQALVDLAEQAFTTRKDVPWVLSILFDHAIRNENWSKAFSLHKTMSKADLYTDEELLRKKALIYAAHAEDLEAQHLTDEAFDEAKKAYRVCDTDLSVTLIYGRLLLLKGEARKARKIIQNIWARTPHPDLGSIFAATLSEKSSAERIKYIAGLHDTNPTHPTSLLFLAESYMKESLWGEARPLLEKLAQTHPTQDVFTALAELEEEEYGNKAKAHEWLKQASHAKPSEAWNCSSCGHLPAQHFIICPHCHSFDSIVWGRATVPQKHELLTTGFAS